MNTRVLKLGALFTTVAVLVTALAAACGGGEPEELDIPVSVAGEAMSPETIKVKQGDRVTLKIQADKAGEFHLHTYDVKMDIEPGEATDFFFVADATGRFRITFHPSAEEDEGEGEHEDEEVEETDIGFLEVQPR